MIIYNKTNNTYYISNETITYAFNSHFDCDMSKCILSSDTGEKIKLNNSYNYGKEIFHFVVRLLLTLAVEMLLALVFKFNKKSFIIILITNIVTQICLNIGLNLSAYFCGIGTFAFNAFITYYYIIIELTIVVIESIIYKIFCRREKEETRDWIVAYTVLANVLSFGIGTLLWFVM